MGTLITTLSSAAPRMTPGERRLAQRLQQKLDADYLVWFDVPVGPMRTHPDFVVLHPSRGVLILEVKDWALPLIQRVDREMWDIQPDGRHKRVINPILQARHGAHDVVRALERDLQLVHEAGAHQGKLAFPWGYGVVFTKIDRAEFDAAGLGEVIDGHAVMCADEMTESVDPEAFQERLWGMFPRRFPAKLTLPQIDRVRWIMFPDVRVDPPVASLFDAAASPDSPEGDAGAAAAIELPDVMKVMDLQQEQLARSLGAGHRVVHGVAGSGKTMILGYRAEYLARLVAPGAKPVLVLCFNEPLGAALSANFASRGLADRVQVRHFHRWARQQLVTFGQPLPPDGPHFFDDLVGYLIRAVDRGHVPRAQYSAVLIDEGHDFRPEWLHLVVQMVDPETNSLLLLYDDAQNIYGRGRTPAFSFKSVGIQAVGRTTILRVNYRNTTQILRLAQRVAGDILKPQACDEDGAPLLGALGCGRDGEEPDVRRLPTLSAEAAYVAQRFAAAARDGRAWSDMAVLCHDTAVMDACASALRRGRIPHSVRRRPGDFRPEADTVKILTMRVSKGLEFPVVAIPGVGRLPAPHEDDKDAARLFYVAATRATERLLVTVSGDGSLGQRLGV